MRLSRVKIRTFRCFKDEIAVDIDDITALIGKNDAGKYSILEALNMFFNEENPDKDEASKSGTASDIAITCEFGDLPSEVIIDENSQTTLRSEFLLNQRGNLVLQS